MLGFESHDHRRCIASAVRAADRICRDEGLQLTPTRRRVLEILLEAHRAVGAYEILETLGRGGAAPQPPVAYRALDFLTRNEFAHRIERLNAFVACTRPGSTHAPAFLICSVCDAVAEADSQPARIQLEDAAKQAGFTIEQTVVEAVGICPKCREHAR